MEGSRRRDVALQQLCVADEGDKGPSVDVTANTRRVEVLREVRKRRHSTLVLVIEPHLHVGDCVANGTLLLALRRRVR